MGILAAIFRLNLQTTRLLMSSTEVIYYRSDMIHKAMSGQMPWADPEFTTMWQEKYNANLEAYIALQKNLAKNPLNLTACLEVLTEVGRPYHKKAAANVKRLRRGRKQ